MDVSYLRYAFLGALFGGLTVALLLFLMTGRGLRLRVKPPRVLRARRERFPGQVPVTLSTFLLGFGAMGLLLSERLGWSPLASLGGAVLSGGILVAAIVAFFRRLFGGEATPMTGGTLVGTVCHVCLAIPSDGVGAVAYHAEGKRHTMAARTVDGHGLSSQTQVLISDLRAGVALVEEF
ncbi:MAG: hypothetical protein ACO1SV_05060 [Fimbriimonas sp.]